MPIDDVLDRLEEAERGWTGRQFLAPILPALPVRVRIAGIVCAIRTVDRLPQGYVGWAVLRASSTRKARFLRAASLVERERYLALFPRVRLIVVDNQASAIGPRWTALPAHSGDRRFRIAGVVPVLLAEEGLERFDTIVARFDGRLFWYDRREAGSNPAIAAYLREQLAQVGPDGLPSDAATLQKRGLSPEQRAAYAMTMRRMIGQGVQETTEQRLSRALAHADARLHSYADHGEVYAVTYEIGGRVHTSTVRRDDLTVAASGICLSGRDEDFDLTSLVSVMREAGAGRLFEDD